MFGMYTQLLKYENEGLIHCISQCPSSPEHKVENGFCVKVPQGGNSNDNSSDSDSNSTIPEDTNDNTTEPAHNNTIPDDNITKPELIVFFIKKVFETMSLRPIILTLGYLNIKVLYKQKKIKQMKLLI